MQGNNDSRPMPLEGYRGVVLTQVWAGPFATELLALLGAEVIQIESRHRPDMMRGSNWNAKVGAGLQEVPTAQHGYNTARFNSCNLNKKSVTLDLSREKGREIFKRLLRVADFYAENFSPRVIKNFGLEYEQLKAVKPDLIVMDMAAYGHSGVYWNSPSTGLQVEMMSGNTEFQGYEDGPPLGSSQAYPDAISGYHAAAALLLALRHRERTGEGQHIELSMQEASLNVFSDSLIEYSLNRTTRRRLGNHHLSLAPHNMYRCRDDAWIAIAVRDEADWQRFCAVSGHPEWQTEECFIDMAARKRNERYLDQLISAWTRDRDARELEELLGGAGLPAGKAREAVEMREVEHLRERAFVMKLDHPETGELDLLGAPFQLSRTPARVTRHSPLHGEHSWEVLSTHLGMSREEYETLEADGITGSGPTDAGKRLSLGDS